MYLLYIAPGKLIGGTAPIVSDAFTVYSNPLPHVLILTAIVVGVATLALGLALVVRIREAYGSIEEDEILAADREDVDRRSTMSVAAHLPALQVVVPLLAAPLSVLLRDRRAAFAVVLARVVDRVRDRNRALAAGQRKRHDLVPRSAAGRRPGASSTASIA